MQADQGQPGGSQPSKTGRVQIRPEKPAWRKLRIFSYDPSLAGEHSSMEASVVTLKVPWEDVGPGPEGDYLQVVDIDHPSGCAYEPADLDNPYCLATDGHDPSEANPKFHQQMVYAVAMSTIGHFERALGRVALWSDFDMRKSGEERDPGGPKNYSFVRRLRIYPHALRDENAYYSSEKKAVLFGYFPATKASAKAIPGTMVFTCLSHDIIAHEVTHALLDGVHHYFTEPVNGDVLAFHEAFADIVALMQHFSYPGVLRNQIAKTRGNLEKESFLGQLAQQFGDATGRGDALRSYLGGYDKKSRKWIPKLPDPSLIGKTREPHNRGAILVAAVFGAFTKVYNRRAADLYRLASEGSGVLRPGEIHPDLVDRLADEAQRTAEYMLQMCVRAMDYCPPAGITFGDFLRGAITGDYDHYPDDRFGYRVALMQSFREWGIYPEGIRSLSIESLLWPTGEEAIMEAVVGNPDKPDGHLNEKNFASETVLQLSDILRRMFSKSDFAEGMNKPDTAAAVKSLENLASEVPDTIVNNLLEKAEFSGEAVDGNDRLQAWLDGRKKAALINDWIYQEAAKVEFSAQIKLIGQAMGFIVNPEHSIHKGKDRGSIRRRENHSKDQNQNVGKIEADLYRIQINSVRKAVRRDRIRAWPQTDLVFEIIQTRDGYFDKAIQGRIDRGELKPGEKDYPREADFRFRTGCTLIIDPVSLKVRRVIKTPRRVDDDKGFDELRNFINDRMNLENAFASRRSGVARHEKFAVLHSHEGYDDHGW